MRIIILMVLFCSNSYVFSQSLLTNTFTYQGELKFNNALANGSYDFQIFVFDVETSGLPLDGVAALGVNVTNGVFSIPITFTNDLFTGNKIWLDIGVRAGGTSDPFDLLSPRQEVTSSPYAIHAQFVGADAVTSTQIFDGTITANDINTSSVQVQVSGVCASGFYMQSINTDGTVNCAMDVTPSAWYLGGNSGTTTGVHYIGTLDTEALEIKTNGNRVAFFGVEATLSGPNIVLGSAQNKIGLDNSGNPIIGATISGGGNPALSFCGTTINQPCINEVLGDYGSIGGGYGNTVNVNSTIGGGLSNSAIGGGDTIGGGSFNIASGSISTIGGGDSNKTTSLYSTIGGGDNNTVNGIASTIGGGSRNTASGDFSTVPGGKKNQAGGDFSMAMGAYAIVRDSIASGNINGDLGTFVWSDSTSTSANKFISTGPNQFLIRATGGVGIGTNNPNGFQLNINGNSNFQGDVDINGNARIPANGLSIGSTTTNGNALNVLGSSYLRNDLDTSSAADLVLGGAANGTNSDDGVLTSDLNIVGSDLIIKSNDAIVMSVGGSSATGGALTVRSGAGATLLQVKGDGVVNSPGFLGSGTSNPTNQLHVKKSISGNTINSHVALIENSSVGATTALLALKMGTTPNPTIAQNFVSFYDGNNARIGQIDGNGAGGILYDTSGADFAEYFPSENLHLAKAQVVALKSGVLSLNTKNADRLFVISTAPGIVGNHQHNNPSPMALVALTGQVPVNVLGKVSAGDWLISSGQNNGTARTIKKEQLHTIDFTQIIGQAIEEDNNGRVKILVGLPQQALIAIQQQIINRQQVQIEHLNQQQSMILAQLKENKSLKQEMALIKKWMLSPSSKTKLAQNLESQTDE